MITIGIVDNRLMIELANVVEADITKEGKISTSVNLEIILKLARTKNPT